MDSEHFLQTGKVVEDLAQVAEYLKKNCVPTLLAGAEKQVAAFADQNEGRHFQPLVEVASVMLIKMVLIRKVDRARATAAECIRDFVSFMNEVIGHRLVWETQLAARYFSGSGDPLGIEASTPYEKARKRVRSTAWDLIYARMPDLLLTRSKPSDVTLGHLCTGDVKLGELAQRCSIRSISSVAGQKPWQPVYELSAEGYAEDVLAILDRGLSGPRPLGQGKQRPPMEPLLEVLEEELRKYCSK